MDMVTESYRDDRCVRTACADARGGRVQDDQGQEAGEILLRRRLRELCHARTVS